MRLGSGARVADAIAAAGGDLEGVDLALLNQAARLTDGQQIVVPAPGATALPGVPGTTGGNPGAAPGAAGGTASPESAGGGAAGAGATSGGEISLNSATSEQLQELNGVGEATAAAIIAYREDNGGFRSVDDLLEVSGIGPAKFEKIRDHVTL